MNIIQKIDKPQVALALTTQSADAATINGSAIDLTNVAGSQRVLRVITSMLERDDGILKIKNIELDTVNTFDSTDLQEFDLTNAKDHFLKNDNSSTDDALTQSQLSAVGISVQYIHIPVSGRTYARVNYVASSITTGFKASAIVDFEARETNTRVFS